VAVASFITLSEDVRGRLGAEARHPAAAAGHLGFGSSMAVWALLALTTAGCAGSYESAVRTDLYRTSRTFGRAPGEERGGRQQLGPSLRDYLAYATERSPELRASYERWRATVHRISPSRRLPDPMVEFGVFVWNSGDNAGLTPARVGVRQEFPWPTKLTAGADAASAEGRAFQRRFEAQLLELRQRVTEAYFRLWLIRRTRNIEREQLEILRGLSESALGQVATGAAALADQQQIDLTAARLEDAIAALDQQERAAQGQLRAAVGAPPGVDTPTEEEPTEMALPAETDEALRQAVLDHPVVESFALMGEAADAAARGQRADRLPGFTVGVEWMRMPGDMGTGALMPSVGIRLPLWQGSYREGIRAAEAEASAQRAESQAVAQRGQAELEEALAMVRDSLRRVELNENTLLPQAEAAYASVLGAYATSRSTVAASLLAQRELLEIRVGLEQARAEHAAAWARLEQVVGRPVDRREVLRRGHDD
jgi:outer membrane protein, heavy metal efflux system